MHPRHHQQRVAHHKKKRLKLKPDKRLYFSSIRTIERQFIRAEQVKHAEATHQERMRQLDKIARFGSQIGVSRGKLLEMVGVSAPRYKNIAQQMLDEYAHLAKYTSNKA